MSLLGALGFDLKTFLIQALNFLILFFILDWLFFKPFIAALRKEKAEAEKLKKAQELIENEKKEWQKQKEQEIMMAKARVENMIAEAEAMVQKMKSKAKEQTFKEEEEAIRLIKDHSQQIIDEYKDKVASDYKEKVVSSILALFQKDFPELARKRIQDNLWNRLIKKIDNVSLPEIIGIIDKIKEEQEKRKQEKEKLGLKQEEEKKQKKIEVNITITSSFPLSSSQKRELATILKERFSKEKVLIEQKVDPNLIAGFSLDLRGMLLEENLRKRIEDLFKK